MLTRAQSKTTRLRALLTDAEGKETRLRASLSKAEKATRLKRSLTEAEERASLTERRVSKSAAEAIKAFQKEEDFRQELLDSYQNAYAKDTWWYGRKVVKYHPNINLGILSSARSSSGSESGSSDVEKDGKATLPTSWLFVLFSISLFVKGLLGLM